MHDCTKDTERGDAMNPPFAKCICNSNYGSNVSHG